MLLEFPQPSGGGAARRGDVGPEDFGQVTGLISIGDLVKWVIHAQRSALSQLEAYVAGGYPG